MAGAGGAAAAGAEGVPGPVTEGCRELVEGDPGGHAHPGG